MPFLSMINEKMMRGDSVVVLLEPAIASHFLLPPLIPQIK